MNNPLQVANHSAIRYSAIGVMSGTSLDGLDLSFARFSHSNGKWEQQIIKAKTIPYNTDLKRKLGNAMSLNGQELALLNSAFGDWIAQRINEFKIGIEEPIDIIGSHGHTVFHCPSLGYTTQIGSGAHIAALTGLPCVCDFRMGDLARGGQGAPLVPIGDELLFGDYDLCLNIGGIVNISLRDNNERIAYDICPANMALNHFSQFFGLEYDIDGKVGKSGNINELLLKTLNQLDYYDLKGPKSLGREWFESDFLPIIIAFNIPTNDILRTLYEHISKKICEAMAFIPKGKVLITGGGAKNSFLVELIKSMSKNSIVIPEPELIDYKEALIFGFLAVLYKLQIPSSLASVTGAKSNSIGGCLYY
ncbi:MAG: anhydro-N-acetylmuramic acid kinase [Bacteroidetes bacterium HGW-Bacteroidetes-15]|nr:MAG: anhydro-N-acetylmuramic acid kinase [Bacteroidetes bacterium HGW-Bacteroidetes-15]